MTPPDDPRIQQQLAALPLWSYNADGGGSIGREFSFGGFAQAFAFMTEVALTAERHDHHPSWSNTWNRVEIAWTSHDVNGLSRRDVELARATEAAWARFDPAPQDEAR